MKNKHVNPSALFNSRPHGFSQAVVSKPGRIVFISGQVAVNKNLKVAGKNNLKKQVSKTIKNLNLVIEAAGGNLNDIVMLRIYKVDFKMEDARVISNMLKKHFGDKSPPASTWINVKGLAISDVMIEIEAQAII